MAVNTYILRKNTKFRNTFYIKMFLCGSGSWLNLCASAVRNLHSSGFPDGAHLVVPASGAAASLEGSPGPDKLYPFSRRRLESHFHSRWECNSSQCFIKKSKMTASAERQQKCVFFKMYLNYNKICVFHNS